MNKKILSIYRKSVGKNLKDISFILKELNIKNLDVFLLYGKLLNSSADNIINKWLSGKKYCRTYFVQKAFSEIYPKKYIRLSLCIDAMVNILDDLLDESLNKKEKVEYVIEFLRIFSIYNKEYPSKKISGLLSRYLNKLITLAVAESSYQEKIDYEKNIDKIITNSVDLLICRGMDIDIFNEIALLGNRNIKKEKTIKDIGRVFRAINILKKDIKDIEHDKKNNIKTTITSICSRNDIDFQFYINSVLKLFTKKVDLILNRIDLSKNRKKSRFVIPIYNFNKMIKNNQKEILKIISN